MTQTLNVPQNRILIGDCLRQLARLPDSCIDLAFADPPFNIGYEYDEYDDRKTRQDYLAWSASWMEQVRRVLSPHGTFWLAIGDEYAAELKVLAVDQLGLTCRSWVIWYYTFGVHCTNKFTRSHAHLFYFVRDPKKFTFDDSRIRVPSARQLVYGDRRANPMGRIPDDTWIMRPVPDESWILRPQDLPSGFEADSDTWYFPRVCGTFKERGGFHGCQMPEQLLGRIVLTTSNSGDLVLDPFAGSGTTLAVAKKLHRRYLGIELSQHYVIEARKRLRAARRGDALAGSAQPTRSAPSTSSGIRLESNGTRSRNVTCSKKKVGATSRARRTTRTIRGASEIDRAIESAFARTHQGWSTDRVIADPNLNGHFIQACRDLAIPGEPVEWNLSLLKLRKANALSHLRPAKVTRVAREIIDRCEFGSESAMAILLNDECTLDALLCDPTRAQSFDEIAMRFAPSNEPSFYYRWAALRIRKRRKKAIAASEELDPSLRRLRFEPSQPLNHNLAGRLDEKPAVYVLVKSPMKAVYVGATANFRERVCAHLKADNNEIDGIRIPKASRIVQQRLGSGPVRYGCQVFQIKRLQPALNFMGLLSA